MKKKISVSGFTIIRNAEKYDFPIVESINSLLPIVDEYVINYGKSNDNTLGLIKSIGSPKIKIIQRNWDDSNNAGGKLFRDETNIALSQISGDWGFYLQADEVLHEKDYATILADIAKADASTTIDAIRFLYYHFKGDYQSIQPWYYQKEIRAIRNNKKIFSALDAVTFHGLEKKRPKALQSKAHIYHYGWVKKPEKMVAKKKHQDSLHWGHSAQDLHRIIAQLKEDTIFEDIVACRVFKKTHPKLMLKRVNSFPPLPRRNRWLYWQLYKKFFKYGWV